MLTFQFHEIFTDQSSYGPIFSITYCSVPKISNITVYNVSCIFNKAGSP
jgi:hypothetical protein